VFIMGRMRFEIDQYIQEEPFLQATVRYLEDLSPKDDQEFDAMLSSVRDITERIISLSPNMPIETGMMLRNIDNNNFLLHYVASNVNASIADKQKLLEESNIKIRTESLLR